MPKVRVGSVLYLDSKSTACSASDDSGVAFTASILPASVAASPGASASVAYTTATNDGFTPASITVKNNDETSASSAVLVLLAPGVRGIAAIPVGTGVLGVSPRTTLSNRFDPLPGPGNRVIETTLALSWEAEGVSLPVPFHLTSSAPWLSFDNSDGVAPAEVRIRADAAGLARGVDLARRGGPAPPPCELTSQGNTHTVIGTFWHQTQPTVVPAGAVNGVSAPPVVRMTLNACGPPQLIPTIARV